MESNKDKELEQLEMQMKHLGFDTAFCVLKSSMYVHYVVYGDVDYLAGIISSLMLGQEEFRNLIYDSVSSYERLSKMSKKELQKHEYRNIIKNIN